MFNSNLILNTASELNLSLITTGDLNKIFKKIDGFKPKNDKDFLHLNENESQELKNTQLDLNQLKKVRMQIKIVKLGIQVSDFNDLNELQERNIENLIKIDTSILSKIEEISLKIYYQKEVFKNLINKDNETIVKEYNLMPETTLMMLFFSILIIVSIIASYLGYSQFFLKEKYTFFNETSAFWTILLGGLICLLSINYLFQNIFIKMKQIKNKDKIYDELVTNFLNKREKKINKTLLRLRKEKFEIERKSIKAGSVLKLKELLIEETNLLSSLNSNFH